MGQQARLIDWKWKQERINGVHTMEGKTAMGAIVGGGRRKMRQQSIETKLATPLSSWFREQQKTHIQHFCIFTPAAAAAAAGSVYFSPLKQNQLTFHFSHLEMIHGVSFTRVFFCLFSFLPSLPIFPSFLSTVGPFGTSNFKSSEYERTF